MQRSTAALLAVGGGGLLAAVGIAWAATIVPTEIEQPGTQPGEVAGLQNPTRCDNCHGGYDAAVEPARNWRGSMMAQAARDPLFWATVAVAEQDFDGVGDLCLRCHTPDGWIGGRSTPTDGSGLHEHDAYGVSCDTCHTMTNPDDTEHLGEQFAPFLANDGDTPPEGWYGSGMYVLWGDSDKLGPYADATGAKHKVRQSRFHRSEDLCGTCHDVSNPVVGDLAPGNGAQVPLASGTYSGVPGGPVTAKAALNNAPYAYGVVERTYSEHKASAWPRLAVADYAKLPTDLRAGIVTLVWERAQLAGKGGDYADGTTRTFTCQTCHMAPVVGRGANKTTAPVRGDLPLHDMTGGNVWVPDAIAWMDARGELVLGGGLLPDELAALDAGKARATTMLTNAAVLDVVGDTVRVTNLTGHKLISGYPEGRRMWLRATWYDGDGARLREDGAYGDLSVTIDGTPETVRTLLDPDGTRVYAAHYGLTQDWADTLVGLGWDASMPLEYDAIDGTPGLTLGELAAAPDGTTAESFHFVLNNAVLDDNRIPPYGFAYDAARTRNALPVPATQYGAPGPGGVFDHYDDVPLAPPAGAAWADIELLYQTTSWEYIQFLYLANDGSVTHLADTGEHLLEAWLNTGMAEPVVMASARWGSPPCTTTEGACDDGLDADCDGLTDCDDPDCTTDPSCAVSACDGDGTCELGEDCVTCRSDCAGITSGKPTLRFCCGNGIPEGPEGDGSGCDGNY